MKYLVRANHQDKSHPEQSVRVIWCMRDIGAPGGRSLNYRADKAEPFLMRRDAHMHRSRHSRQSLVINGLDRGVRGGIASSVEQMAKAGWGIQGDNALAARRFFDV